MIHEYIRDFIHIRIRGIRIYKRIMCVICAFAQRKKKRLQLRFLLSAQSARECAHRSNYACLNFSRAKIRVCVCV